MRCCCSLLMSSMLSMVMLLMRTRYSRVDDSDVFIPFSSCSSVLQLVSNTVSMANVPIHRLPSLQPQSCKDHKINVIRNIPCRECWKAQPYQQLVFGGRMSFGRHNTRVETRRRRGDPL
jgi:hypothetical protein